MQRKLGHKRYEAANHLGNVLATFTDYKAFFVEADGRGFFKAEVASASDYYPFGQEMDGRSFSQGGYRFGFNGKENDREWGSSLIQDYGFRLYNPAIGKFLSVDPLTSSYPWYTPYQFAGNMPIRAVDLDGLEPIDHNILRKIEQNMSPYIVNMDNAPDAPSYIMGV